MPGEGVQFCAREFIFRVTVKNFTGSSTTGFNFCVRRLKLEGEWFPKIQVAEIEPIFFQKLAIIFKKSLPQIDVSQLTATFAGRSSWFWNGDEKLKDQCLTNVKPWLSVPHSRFQHDWWGTRPFVGGDLGEISLSPCDS
jgi:hypothetical protein